MSISAIENTASQTLQNIEWETKAEHATLDREDFMKLFITQLQYQDPMNPMESAEMASQVAQFNMVDLLYKNNEALENMAKAQNISSSVSAVDLLGKKVEYQAEKILMGDDGPEPFSVEAPDDARAEDVKITIFDEHGQKIKELDMGPVEPGEKKSLNWDGTDEKGEQVKPGTYRVVVDAVDADGEPVDVTAWTTGIVTAIDQNEEGLPKVVIGNGPAVDLDQITKILT